MEEEFRGETMYRFSKMIDKFNAFRKLLSFPEQRTGRSLNILRSDGGAKRADSTIYNFLKAFEIKYERTKIYTPKQR